MINSELNTRSILFFSFFFENDASFAVQSFGSSVYLQDLLEER